jgi:HPt (histidine-containing phosphotransfer) domain-containing protein
MGAEPGLVQELIGLLKEDVPPRILSLASAVDSADENLSIQEAHQLKGATGNLGLQHFADLAGRIEDCVREGRWGDTRGLVKELPAAYDEALAALVAAFPED